MVDFINAIDSEVLDILFVHRTESMTSFFLFITQLGDWQWIFGLSAAVVLWCMLHKHAADGAGLATCILGTSIFVLIVKVLIDRARPLTMYQVYSEGAYYSFPSAHTALAAACYGFLFYLVLQIPSTLYRRALLVVLPIIIVLIGFSRLYLGVHYLSDVLVGATIGLFFIGAARMMRNRLLPHYEHI